jgi:hemoglobin
MNAESLFDRLGGRPGLLKLLRHFYADVRQHQLLGPIFNTQIHDWPAHIEKIGDFWSTVTGGPPAYSGGMPAPHIPLGLREEHFQAWLGLWDVNCRTWLSPECAKEMSTLATQIGKRLRQFCGVTQASDSIFGPSRYSAKAFLKS